MRILALQLKRIGDLILTTPALRLLRAACPEAELALAVTPECAPLLGAIDSADSGIVLGRGRGFAPWQQVLTGSWDLCFDFTGSDRSALAAAASRARERITFAQVKRSTMRALAYNQFVDSSVRQRHTVDHYLDLLAGSLPAVGSVKPASGIPHLALPAASRLAADDLLHEAGVTDRFVLVHPGTARTEKFWLPERWAEVIASLPLPCVLTGGRDSAESAHISEIQSRLPRPVPDFSGRLDLLTLAALIERAELILSCDTAAMHFAAAFQRPQIALFGPTNPFHWRPRHQKVVVLSAAQPVAPLRKFMPRMKGADMEQISTALVINAIASLSPSLT